VLQPLGYPFPQFFYSLPELEKEKRRIYNKNSPDGLKKTGKGG